jgi:hypothetical protein
MRRRGGSLPGEMALPFDLGPVPSGEPVGDLAVVEMSTVGAAPAVDPVPVPVASAEVVRSDVPGVGGWAPAAAAPVGTAGGQSGRHAASVRPAQRRAPGGRRPRPAADGQDTTPGPSDTATDTDAVRRWVAEQLARAPAPSDARVATIVGVLGRLAASAAQTPAAAPDPDRRSGTAAGA